MGLNDVVNRAMRILIQRNSGSNVVRAHRSFLYYEGVDEEIACIRRAEGIKRRRYARRKHREQETERRMSY